MQDLDIDLQALAASLSNVPVWSVLDIDAALCKSCLSDKESSLHHSASISKESKPNHGPQHTVQFSIAAHSRSTVETLMNDCCMGRSAESSSQPAATPVSDLDTSLARTSPAAMQTQPAAPGPSLSSGDQHHNSASLQTGGDAAAGSADMDDLDALLNAASLSIKPQASLAGTSKPARKEQESLEDWLDSL